MLTIEYYTPAEGLNVAMSDIFANADYSHWQKSRNGNVRASDEPVMLVNNLPMRRVLVDEKRDANPFFHVYEAMWMLAGRNDVKSVAQFNKRMAEFSDDGETLHGAYGHRWRKHFGYDQLDEAIRMLQKDLDTRRCVVGMWDPYLDFTIANAGGKDVPCNTQLMFQMDGSSGELNMTVINRSNDLIWGTFGANIVHMSFVHEYVARGAGMDQGRMYTFTNNLHLYERHWELSNHRFNDVYDNAENQEIRTPLFFEGEWEPFNEDVRRFADDPYGANVYKTPFLNYVAKFMMWAHEAYMVGRYKDCGEYIEAIADPDWKVAALNWILPRLQKRLGRQIKSLAEAVQEERTEKAIQIVQAATPAAIEEAKKGFTPPLMKK